MTRKKNQFDNSKKTEQQSSSLDCRGLAVVTGAASGIGYETTRLLSQNGFKVYALVRRVESVDRLMQEFASQPKQQVIAPHHLDVSNQKHLTAGIDAVIKQISTELGLLQKTAELVLVNNAGFSLMGSAEETPLENLRQIMETNFMGAAALSQKFIPLMRHHGRGKIIQISSSYGRVGAPFMSAYCASKFALEGFSEAMRYELLPSQIYVSLVEPGPVSTNFRKKSFIDKEPAISNYRAIYELYNRRLATGKKWSSSPEKVARVILKISNSKKPRLRYAVGLLGKAGSKTAQWLPAVFHERLYRPPA